jgi:hypothetical protein
MRRELMEARASSRRRAWMALMSAPETNALSPAPGHDEDGGPRHAHRVEGLVELGHRLGVEGVADVRAVHGEGGHPPVHFQPEVAVAAHDAATSRRATTAPL